MFHPKAAFSKQKACSQIQCLLTSALLKESYWVFFLHIRGTFLKLISCQQKFLKPVDFGSYPLFGKCPKSSRKSSSNILIEKHLRTVWAFGLSGALQRILEQGKKLKEVRRMTLPPPLRAKYMPVKAYCEEGKVRSDLSLDRSILPSSLVRKVRNNMSCTSCKA